MFWWICNHPGCSQRNTGCFLRVGWVLLAHLHCFRVSKNPIGHALGLDYHSLRLLRQQQKSCTVCEKFNFCAVHAGGSSVAYKTISREALSHATDTVFQRTPANRGRPRSILNNVNSLAQGVLWLYLDKGLLRFSRI